MRRVVPFLTALLIAVTSVVAFAARPMASHEPALHGYCPVAYSEGMAVKGDPKFASMFHGQHYLFVNADAKKLFDASPAKFDVKYEGWCATAVAMGKKVPSDPALFTRFGDHTYLFSNADAKKAFDAMQAETAKKADTQWQAWMKKK